MPWLSDSGPKMLEVYSRIRATRRLKSASTKYIKRITQSAPSSPHSQGPSEGMPENLVIAKRDKEIFGVLEVTKQSLVRGKLANFEKHTYTTFCLESGIREQSKIPKSSGVYPNQELTRSTGSRIFQEQHDKEP